MYKLTEDQRGELGKPLGLLIEGEPDKVTPTLKNYLADAIKIIAIGDVLTSYMEKYQIKADVYIIDGINKRKEYSTEFPEEAFIFKTDNKPGYIEAPAMDLVRLVLEYEDIQSVIFVNGEEDLLTIPAIIYSPLNSKILYGQPEMSGYKGGVVILEVDEELKEKAKTIMNEMEY